MKRSLRIDPSSDRLRLTWISTLAARGDSIVQDVRAVFLDVGGTLAYPHPSFHTLIAQVCQDEGLPVTPEQVEAAEPAVWARISERDDRGSGFTMSVERSQEFWHFVYQTFLREIGFPDAADTELPR